MGYNAFDHNKLARRVNSGLRRLGIDDSKFENMCRDEKIKILKSELRYGLFAFMPMRWQDQVSN